ncbi:MAG: hypothetical protein V2I32_01815 [Desulforhopalus sp.]|jgi:hypothetical protein|nr:hypothetical protein [Desulforhopalus sp.]
MKRVCPLCGVRGALADEHLGRKVRCPKCHGIFVAEEADSDPAGVALPEEVLEAVVEPTGVPIVAVPTGDGADQTASSGEAAALPESHPLELEKKEDVAGAAGDAGEPEGFTVEETGESSETIAQPTAGMAGAETESAQLSSEWRQSGETPAPQGVEQGAAKLEEPEPEQPAEQPASVEQPAPIEQPAPVQQPEPVAGFSSAESTDESRPGTAAPAWGIVELLGEAWRRSDGVKGAILAGSAVMYLITFALAGAGTYLFFPAGTAEAAGGFSLFELVFQTLVQVVVMIFTAGLLRIGINQAVGDTVSWRMVFSGFSFAGKIAVATILQTILISIGFLLLILPGIYLSVGYAMTLPLIIDKGLSPWEAMEASRKAVHRVWWKIAALFVVIGVIMALSAIPLGVGLIWTWPMFIVLAGIVYHRLFTRTEGGV